MKRAQLAAITARERRKNLEDRDGYITRLEHKISEHEATIDVLRMGLTQERSNSCGLRTQLLPLDPQPQHHGYPTPSDFW